MPLTLSFQPSFQRSLKRLGPEQQRTVGRLLEALQAYYANGCDLAAAQHHAPRFFYKQLRKPYHDQIRQFLADA